MLCEMSSYNRQDCIRWLRQFLLRLPVLLHHRIVNRNKANASFEMKAEMTPNFSAEAFSRCTVTSRVFHYRLYKRQYSPRRVLIRSFQTQYFSNLPLNTFSLPFTHSFTYIKFILSIPFRHYKFTTKQHAALLHLRTHCSCSFSDNGQSGSDARTRQHPPPH